MLGFQGTQVNFKSVLESTGSDKSASLKSIADALEKQLTKTPIDQGSTNIVWFVRTLSDLLSPGTEKLSIEAKDSLLIVEAKLAKSQRDVRVRIYFGLTDLLTNADAEYWKSLAYGLGHDDVVLYTGHSGLGENMKLSHLLAATGLTENDLLRTAPANQVIGIFSCYSYSYFGEEIAQARARVGSGNTTHYLRTSSAFSTELGHLKVLEQIDLMHSTGSRSPASVEFEPTDFVIGTRYEVDSTPNRILGRAKGLL